MEASRRKKSLEPSPRVDRIKRFLYSSIQLILQPQIIRYHRNKLAVGGFSAVVLNSISKITVQCIHVASVPRDLDGVADGTLHAAGRGGILFGDGRVEHLGDRIDNIAVLDGEENGSAEILIALF